MCLCMCFSLFLGIAKDYWQSEISPLWVLFRKNTIQFICWIGNVTIHFTCMYMLLWLPFCILHIFVICPISYTENFPFVCNNVPQASIMSIAMSMSPQHAIRWSLRWRRNGHYSVSNHQPHHCLLNRLFGCRSKKTSKLRVTGLCAENSPGTDEFPAQKASNAQTDSIWWRHHALSLANSNIMLPDKIRVFPMSRLRRWYLRIYKNAEIFNGFKRPDDEYGLRHIWATIIISREPYIRTNDISIGAWKNPY